MFSDTQFWRLVWKEYRVQRPLWLALLIATPFLQAGMLGMRWVFDDFRMSPFTTETANALTAIGFIASVIYLLGCSATMFSVEHETGVFDFQRVLPTNQARVFLAKVGFAFVSCLLLTVALWLVTRGVFLSDGPRGSTWFGTYGLLYMAEVFAWSIFASLLIRQPLWGVIAAVALQSWTMQVVLPYLTTGRADGLQWLNQERPFLVSRFLVLAVLIVADMVLGRLWFEDRLRLPRWRFRWKPDFVPSYATNVELPAYVGQRQIGWSRLLWLSWRDGRWVMAGVLACYGYLFLTLRLPGGFGVLALVSFVGCFVFGLFAFAPEQWGGRFRFLTERGGSPRTAWFCRQVIWLPPIVLMCVGTAWKFSQEQANYQRPIAEAAVEAMMMLVYPLIGYSAGQLAAMLFRSTVMAIAIGIGLYFVGGMWGALMLSWLAPIWWTVGSLPAIGLFVTWLKANDWVEERRDRTARWRTALGLGVPVMLLLISTATYRVVQIPAVTLPAEWDETPQVLARLTPAEKETLAIYRRALAEIEAGEDWVEMYAARNERVRKEHPNWTVSQINVETFEGFHRDWWKQHAAAVVPLLREAHKMAPVPLALLDAEPATRLDEWNPDRISKLPWLMSRQAEQSLRDGELDQTWDDIVIAFELQRRFDQRAVLLHEPFSGGMGSASEGYLLLTVAKWGRHKEQTRERVLAAIRKLEEILVQPGAGRRNVHHDLLEAQSILNGDERWNRYIATLNDRIPFYEDLKISWKLWRFFPWERWRAHRAVRLQAGLALSRIDQLQTLMKWNVPMPIGSQAQMAAFQKIAAQVPEVDRIKLNAANPLDHNTPLATMLRMTLMPQNLRWDRQDSTLRPRLESFRATILLLALADFHREHKRYPESLAELAPTYFAEVPRDPQTAGPFVYFPHGVSEDVTVGDVDRGDFRTIIHKDVPFLWSAGQITNIFARATPSGGWEFVDDRGQVRSLENALKHTSVWALVNEDTSSDL